MVETSFPVIGYRGIEGIGWKVRTLSSSHVFAITMTFASHNLDI